MTKAIRIENADTSNHKVRVYVEQKDASGAWVRTNVPAYKLDNPTDLLTLHVFSSQRLVVEEVQ